MSSLNKVQLIGRITQDIELKATPNGHNVCSFGLATNKRYTDKQGEVIDKAQFHNIVLWNKSAEIVEKYANKWDKIYIEWELETRTWENTQGEKRYTTEIIGNNIILLWNKNNWNAKAVVDSKEEELSIEDLPF